MGGGLLYFLCGGFHSEGTKVDNLDYGGFIIAHNRGGCHAKED